jgi:hypothetical protein
VKIEIFDPRKENMDMDYYGKIVELDEHPGMPFLVTAIGVISLSDTDITYYLNLLESELVTFLKRRIKAGTMRLLPKGYKVTIEQE